MSVTIIAISGDSGVEGHPHLHFHLWSPSTTDVQTLPVRYDLHTIPFVRLLLKRVNVDSDFREYSSALGDLDDADIAITHSSFESSNVESSCDDEAMVSYWKFDEGFGTITSDSARANSASLVNSPSWTGGILGKALSFDGSSSYVWTNDNIKITNSRVSIETWVNLKQISAQEQQIAEIRTGTNEVYLEFKGGTSQVFWTAGFPTAANALSQPLSLNQWHHLVGTYEGTNQKLYVDGVLASSAPLSSSLNIDAPLLIGKDPEGSGGGQYLNGIVDEVAVYNRALTSEEVQQHYQTTLNGLGYCHKMISRDPLFPFMLNQFQNGFDKIPLGGEIQQLPVSLRGATYDPKGHQLKLQVELRRLDELDGQFDETKGGLKESGWVNTNVEAHIMLDQNDLSVLGSYHWRARFIDSQGYKTPWQEFGGNDISEADFVVKKTCSKNSDCSTRICENNLCVSKSSLPETIDLRDLELFDDTFSLFEKEADIFVLDDPQVYFAGESVPLSVRVMNTGIKAGDYVPLLYIVNENGEMVATNDFSYAGLYKVTYKAGSGIPKVDSIYIHDLLRELHHSLKPGEDYLFEGALKTSEYYARGHYYIIAHVPDYTYSGLYSGNGQDQFLYSFTLGSEFTMDELKEKTESDNRAEAFVRLKKDIQDSEIYKDKIPVYFHAKLPTTNENINMVVATSIAEVSKKYRLVKINMGMDSDDILYSGYVSTFSDLPSRSSCYENLFTTFRYKWLLDPKVNGVTVLISRVAGKAFGRIPNALEVALKLDEYTMDCVGGRYKTELSRVEDIKDGMLIYLPEDVEIEIFIRGERYVPSFLLLSEAGHDSWRGVIPEDLSSANPATINLDISKNPGPNIIFAMERVGIASPGELRVYDSKGRVTGLINETLHEEIPNSTYSRKDKTVTIYDAIDTYRYEVFGIEKPNETTYGLWAIHTNSQENIFYGENISIGPGEIHDYSVDWGNTSNKNLTVTLQVDKNGDGTPEQIITSGPEFHIDKTLLYYEGDFSGTYSDYTTLSAKLLLENGTGLSNKNISFEMANQTINSTTDENGTASVILPLNFSPRNYSLNLTFAGDNEYLYSINSTVFEVKKEITNTSISSSESFFGDLVLFSANLTDDEGNALQNKNILFKIGNISLGSNQTNVSGTTILWWNTSVIPKSLEESYNLSVAFAGDDYYEKSSANATFTLKSAKWLKNDSLNDLKSITLTDKSMAKENANIIKDVNASLASSLWIDSSHLNSKKGSTVFAKEHEAVISMYHKSRVYQILIPAYGKLVDSRLCSAGCLKNLKPQLESMKAALPVYESSVSSLVKADELLAEVSLLEAQNCLKNPAKAKQAGKYLSDAQNSFRRALKNSENRPDLAILEFKNSWMSSQKAKEFC